ncbi:DUF748 domain-containing protein [Chitinolyticbacter albus]|uniref:DUF748 domain-containing protein n=1 Tax=Chitinolyticbacter albus TaxID=2961951 RepID=UPI00210A14E3|nr:DUF748 domain-containing protein [Chitinolyticbacter albus]
MKRRLLFALLALLIVLPPLTFWGFRLATRQLQQEVLAALGPEAHIASLELSWSTLEIRGLRIKAPAGWPATETLVAEHVVLRPELRTLFFGQVRIRKIEVEGAYLSIWRQRNGKVRLLPSLLERKAEAPAVEDASAATQPAVKVLIDAIKLANGRIDWFDGNVRKKPLRVAFEQLEASIGTLRWPELSDSTPLRLAGVIKGVRHDGQFALDGHMRFADHDSQLKLALQQVDLLALQPYLIKASETGVKRGTLDLQLASTVKAGHLRAPGRLTLTDLQLAPGRGWQASFMGVPRQAVIAALKNRDGRIVLDFTLSGRVDDPHFTLREDLQKRLAAGMAEGLGISVRGLVEGVGDTVKGLFGQ